MADSIQNPFDIHFHYPFTPLSSQTEWIVPFPEMRILLFPTVHGTNFVCLQTPSERHAPLGYACLSVAPLAR